MVRKEKLSVFESEEKFCTYSLYIYSAIDKVESYQAYMIEVLDKVGLNLTESH